LNRKTEAKFGTYWWRCFATSRRVLLKRDMHGKTGRGIQSWTTKYLPIVLALI
jgi:hypothetical protein